MWTSTSSIGTSITGCGPLCLYGTLPANGLIYAGPHNCACYTEAKLDGLNALAPHRPSQAPKLLADEARLEKGPSYDAPLGAVPGALDWPAFRHDNERSGFSDQGLNDDLSEAWDIPIGGQLSALTVADGKAFVAQVDSGHGVRAGFEEWQAVVALHHRGAGGFAADLLEGAHFLWES